MTISSLARDLAIACALCATSACTQGASSSATSTAAGDAGNAARTSGTSSAAADNAWVNNGATACDKYLTPDVVGEIFKSPAGHNEKLAAQGCHFEAPDSSSISIMLTAGGPAVFDAHQPYLDNPIPLSGVGDKAVRTASGIEAVKGNDRMCDIKVMPPFGNKLKGEALAQKLGEICNKLFALP